MTDDQSEGGNSARIIPQSLLVTADKVIEREVQEAASGRTLPLVNGAFKGSLILLNADGSYLEI